MNTDEKLNNGKNIYAEYRRKYYENDFFNACERTYVSSIIEACELNFYDRLIPKREMYLALDYCQRAGRAVKIVLDALVSDAPALSRAQSEQLFADVMAELEGDKRSRYRALKKHPYFNALQVKYAYTVTCHKAQGGQWRNVFIDMGYIADEAFAQLDFFRWLYTAISRARGHVYLINCPLEST